MPNGAHHPQCDNCRHFDPGRVEKGGDRRACRLHDFVMPLLRGEVLCRDWERRADTQSDAEWKARRERGRYVVYEPEAD